MTDASAATLPPALPPENVGRGTMFALLAVPAGVILWVLIWSIGFIASIVGFAVAAGAMFLYRFGAGGRIGRGGAIRVTLITIGTLLLAFFAGLVADGVTGFTEGTDINPIGALTDTIFWDLFFQVLAEPGVLAEYAPSFAIALGLGLLGCFSVLRSAFAAASAPPAAEFFAQPPLFESAPATSATEAAAGSDAAPAQPKFGEYAAPAAPEASQSPEPSPEAPKV